MNDPHRYRALVPCIICGTLTPPTGPTTDLGGTACPDCAYWADGNLTPTCPITGCTCHGTEEHT